MNRIRVFLKHPDKKSLLKMIKEIITLMVKKREIPFYYFKYLYRKKVTNYLDYISFREQVLLVEHRSLHNPDYVALINNKLYFALFCKRTSIKTPKLISYNLGTCFFFNDNVVQISNKEQLSEFFENLFNIHKTDELFFRPPSDFGGKGCFKIKKLELQNDLDNIYETLINGNFVHTEVIKQHDDINKIHSKSVNTIRFISLITSKGTIEIISSVFRFGVGDSVVDNATSGGFFVGIDLEKGVLKSVGHYLPEHGGGEITEHPDSGFKLEGFKVPYFKEACDIVKEAVKIIPDRFIGWDVAITPNGPIIIESNAEPHVPVSDISYGGLLKNPHIKNLVEELKKQ
ncbi:sugar-transfer associated ATP-grasp domain-containing protein [Flavivirga sp. 57AJ16]|uniref:sugar-transfer associated ATP-grasp domain-containing protein n=1 Tax=Flavivirga sp. 57AJ16 TaxID=3025307 RepID=UPI002364FC2E|nr:sugar-transfer associated ATP-grasp domain-containing protein [Flavivirga sp. 57AJ16]MDD7887133.1 sugar-transfer associated ATP-grasp domain-containing protein [Flavivirga sp. 57AJ16]